MTQIRTMTDNIIIGSSIVACERATKIGNDYDNIQCQITHEKNLTEIRLILTELHHKVAQKILQSNEKNRSIQPIKTEHRRPSKTNQNLNIHSDNSSI